MDEYNAHQEVHDEMLADWLDQREAIDPLDCGPCLSDLEIPVSALDFGPVVVPGDDEDLPF